MGHVNYQGKKVSDENIRAVLQRIAEALGDVEVTSGDRDKALSVGAKSKSQHLQHRAVDFHVKGRMDKETFRLLQESHETIFDKDKHYQVIHHGPFTETHGQHVHVGRYQVGTGVTFWVEGLSKETRGRYTQIGLHHHEKRVVGYPKPTVHPLDSPVEFTKAHPDATYVQLPSTWQQR